MSLKSISNLQGKLELKYQKQTEKTKIIYSKNIAPFKVQRPFYPAGTNICHTIVLNTAGGIVGGDKLEQNINLESDSQALITTTSAGKIYRSNGLEAKQDIIIKLESGACLEFLPQENIIFNGANYRQNITIELEPQARWLGWEIVRFGRSARGEVFLTGKWLSSMEIWQSGKPLWIDKQALWGSEESVFSPNALAGNSVVGTLSWVFAPVDSDLLVEIRKLWDNFDSDAQVGVTQLLSGLVCRYRGNSTTEAKKWFQAVGELLTQQRYSFIKF